MRSPRFSLIFIVFLTLFSLLASPAPAYSADQAINQSSATSSVVRNSTSAAVAPQHSGVTTVTWLSNYEFWMSSSVLIFGLLVFMTELYLMRHIPFKPEQSIKLIAVTLIIVSTLFIITAGFSSEQIAPAMGLFGTVAGYMLGRSQSGKEGEAQ